MVVQPSTHGDFHYTVETRRRTGRARVHEFASEDPLEPGGVLRLDGRYWLIETVEPAKDEPARALSEPARYRLRLRHPDGREELGGFRRFRTDAPRVGHSFTTLENGDQVSWEVVEQRLERDEQGAAYLDFVAERDYDAPDSPADHELEHTLAGAGEDEPPTSILTTLSRAEQLGLSIELEALEPGEEPDWDEAGRFIDALVIEEVSEDLLELSGVDPDHDPRDRWLETVKERLRSDLGQFRADLEADDQIEQWEFLDGTIFATSGTPEDEADPLSPHGWMCRLQDAEVLAAAGFVRVRKAELEPA
jgi:hypothetical protein